MSLKKMHPAPRNRTSSITGLSKDLFGLSTDSIPVGLGLCALLAGQVVLARVGGPAVFGTFSYALTWITSASLFAKSGHDMVVTKMLPVLQLQEDFGKARSLITKTILHVTLESVLYLILLAALLYLNPLHFSSATINSLVIGAPLIVTGAVMAIRKAAMIAMRHFWASELPDSIGRPILVAAILYGLSQFTRVTAEQMMLTYLFVFVFLFVAGIGWTLWLAPKELFVKSQTHFDWSSVRALRNFCRMDNLVNVLLRNTDILIVGSLTTAAATGLYVVATRVALIGASIVMVLDPIVAPRISGLHATQQSAELEKLARHYWYLANAFSIVFVMVFFRFGHEILSIFGRDYQQAYGVTFLLILGPLVSALTGPTGMLLLMTGLQKSSFWITVISTIFYLGLLFVLVPRFSILGAAAASSAGLAARNILQSGWLWLKLNIHSTPLSLIKIYWSKP